MEIVVVPAVAVVTMLLLQLLLVVVAIVVAVLVAMEVRVVVAVMVSAVVYLRWRSHTPKTLPKAPICTMQRKALADT